MEKFVTIILSMCFFQIFNISCVEKILIYIDPIVREIDSQTSCNISDWVNKQANACKCCLFKQVPLMQEGKKTAKNIVDECIEKGLCTLDLIDTFKGSEDLEKALNQLYNSSVVIKKIEKENIYFDEKNNFTELGLKYFLEKAYKEDKLPNKDFKSVTCLEIKDLLATKRGAKTLQLFLVQSDCGNKDSYIFKEVQHISEVERLANFLSHPEIKDITLPNHVKDYASLANPIAFFQFDNHYFTLAPKAPGNELEELIIDYFSKPSEQTKKNVEQAFYDFGFALANFHQKFMKNKGKLEFTVIHSDPHPKNVFYDQKSHQITLIDNEYMPHSFNKRTSLLKDIFKSIFIQAPGFSTRISNVTYDQYIMLIAAPFLKGYISIFPEQDRLKIFDQLSGEIKTYNYKGKGIFYNRHKNVIDETLNIVKKYLEDQSNKKKEALLYELIQLKNSLSQLLKLLA